MALSGWSDRVSLVTGRNLTLANLMDRLAAVHTERWMVHEAGGPDLTFRQAGQRVVDMSASIAARIQTGDRVVLALPNSYDLWLASLAAARAGAVPVPLNGSELTDREIDLVAGDAGAAVVVRSAADLLEGKPAAAPSEPHAADPKSVAAIFYTSGTTGRPKGARLTHKGLIGQLGAASLFPSGLRHDEAVFGLPLSHIMGFISALSMAAAGVSAYFLPRFRPDEALDAIESRGASIFIGVPAMYRLMDEAGAEERDLSSVRVWISGADAMPPELAKKFRRLGAAITLPGLARSVGEATFVEGYGMVETGGGVALKLSLPFLSFLPGDSVGIPMPPNRMRVVGEDGNDVPAGQVGELWVKGPGLLQGYHGDEAHTREVLTEDGWLKTGDMARRGAFGMIHFAGREKDVIKRGGYSVYAIEVEGVLEEHPAVAEAAVVGLPDARLGEVPAAAIRVAPGKSVSEEELAAWAKERMASYKCPTRYVFAAELPRTGTKKVRRAEVKPLFD
jgi:long-chain acyl-CoA synthetase